MHIKYLRYLSIILLLVACQQSPEESLVITKNKNETPPEIPTPEYVLHNNCGGPATITYRTQKKVQVTEAKTAELGVSAEIIEAKILASLGLMHESEKFVEFAIPKNTMLYAKLEWSMAEHKGTMATQSGVDSFRVLEPVNVKVVESADMGCPKVENGVDDEIKKIYFSAALDKEQSQYTAWGQLLLRIETNTIPLIYEIANGSISEDKQLIREFDVNHSLKKSDVNSISLEIAPVYNDRDCLAIHKVAINYMTKNEAKGSLGNHPSSKFLVASPPSICNGENILQISKD